MKVKVQWNVSESNVLKYAEGMVIEVSEAEYRQANNDSPGCLVVVEDGEAPGNLPGNDRMLRGNYQTRAPQQEAMHSGNMPGISRTALAREHAATVAAPAGKPADNVSDTPVGATSDSLAGGSEPVGDDSDIDATEAAVALAEENGVDLGAITGTGKDGRITVGDVRAVLE